MGPDGGDNDWAEDRTSLGQIQTQREPVFRPLPEAGDKPEFCGKKLARRDPVPPRAKIALRAVMDYRGRRTAIELSQAHNRADR